MLIGNDSVQYRKTVLVSLGVLGACAIMSIVLLCMNHRQHRERDVIIDWNSPQFIGERSYQYNAIFVMHDIDEELPEEVIEEFKEDEYITGSNNMELINTYGISFKEGTLSPLGVECNSALYDLCNKYFLASYHGIQLSPLLPMAVANVETPERANNRITYSSLFPSGVVSVTSPDAIVNMSCVAVLEDEQMFNAMASDYTTLKRGPLQLSDSYGTSHSAYNSLMGPSEASILTNVAGVGIDYSGYQAYEASTLHILTVNDWLARVSANPGDRYNTRDSVLRFASVSQDSVNKYVEQYDIRNDMELVSLVAIGHNTEGVWDASMASKGVGSWRSGVNASNFVKDISGNDFVAKVRDLQTQNLQMAREENRKIPMGINKSEVRELYNEAVSQGILSEVQTYTYGGSSGEDTTFFPIQVMYSYLMLAAVYSGN